MGPTLTLAKLADHVAKNWPEFEGVCLLDDLQMRKNLFEQLPPSAVWGIGRKIAKKLLDNGVDTVAKLAGLKSHEIRRTFNNVEIVRTINELNGEPCKIW